MNSGLPYLLDALFNKNDLSSVSLEEINELINEFPSFNAGHYLLSKKLKEEDGAAYQEETRRTALYFNNPFWLKAVLDEENKRIPEVKSFLERDNAGEEKDQEETDSAEFSSLVSETRVEEIMTTEPGESGSSVNSQEIFQGPVSSFDDLLAKYKVESNALTGESIPEEQVEPNSETISESAENISIPGNTGAQHTETQPHFIPPEEPVSIETREEISNSEYGIFDDEIVKNPEREFEDFNRPVETTTTPGEPPESGIGEAELQSVETEIIDEVLIPEKTAEITNEDDYEAFDRPINIMETEVADANMPELKPELIPETRMQEADADATEFDSGEPVTGSEEIGHRVLDQFSERSESLAAFDPKNAGSIVFAPYHMVDYFASQGIKLIMEDQPSDQFGKQLKSFTDWLKVMKRVPAIPVTETTDEKEVDRIRHFAAHSIEERDILTESMAEVLAKQGMVENAIALYQKLSLIYPPKSAYFASRIDQLKAALP